MFSTAPTLDWEIDVAWVICAKANRSNGSGLCGCITLAHVKDIAPRVNAWTRMAGRLWAMAR